ncbi:MAG: hypothetical protein NC311_08540 [Muribaculaceae bacterium]|nr:hypothetical protein [Muribaculaceae bacterium]
MITIIFAPPRTGKTCFMTHIANGFAFDRDRNRAMAREIIGKKNSGFDGIKTVPKHCVSANYDMTFRRHRYSPRFNRRINPYRLGFANPFVETHFNLPYEVICITEAQKYLNSRLSMYFPDWQSRWYEQHGHNNLDIYLDTQRPMLIDVNIRELAQFVEIVRLDKEYDYFGNPCRIKWFTRRIDNSSLFDKYMSSGKQDKSCFTTEIVTADYNVFSCYDSQCCKPKFYEGHLNEDFDYKLSKPTVQTLEGYLRYLEENDDELPENYFQKRGKAA